jgi:chemotaxis signal transduction protein
VDGIVDLSSLAAVPRAPAFVRGLVGFHGEVLLALELSALVGGPAVGFADLRRVIALRVDARKVAIVAERVVSVRAAQLSSFAPDPVRQQPFVIGTDSRFVTLLDPAALISHAFGLLGETGR